MFWLEKIRGFFLLDFELEFSFCDELVLFRWELVNRFFFDRVVGLIFLMFDFVCFLLLVEFLVDLDLSFDLFLWILLLFLLVFFFVLRFFLLLFFVFMESLLFDLFLEEWFLIFIFDLFFGNFFIDLNFCLFLIVF